MIATATSHTTHSLTHTFSSNWLNAFCCTPLAKKIGCITIHFWGYSWQMTFIFTLIEMCLIVHWFNMKSWANTHYNIINIPNRKCDVIHRVWNERCHHFFYMFADIFKTDSNVTCIHLKLIWVLVGLLDRLHIFHGNIIFYNLC